VDFCIRHRNSCFYLPWRNGVPNAASNASLTGAARSQEASMGKLTPEEKVHEHNRGQKAASEGRSLYWSEPWAYPFESDEHFEARREAFYQGYEI